LSSSPPSSPSEESAARSIMSTIVSRRDKNRCVITGQLSGTADGNVLQCCHILHASDRVRQLTRGFVDHLQANHQALLSQYSEYIRPLSDEEKRKWKHHRARESTPHHADHILLLPHLGAFDPHLGIYANCNFNRSIEVGEVWFEPVLQSEVDRQQNRPIDYTVQFSPDASEFVRDKCVIRDENGTVVGRRLLLRPDDDDKTGLRDWPEPVVFDLHREVWTEYCRWKHGRTGRVPSEDASASQSPAPKKAKV